MSPQKKRLTPFLLISACIHLLLFILFCVLSPLVTGQVISQGRFFVKLVSGATASPAAGKAAISEVSSEKVSINEQKTETPEEAAPEEEAAREPAAPADNGPSATAPASAGQLSSMSVQQQIALMDFGQRQILCMKTRHFYSAIKSLICASLGRQIQIEKRSALDGQTAFVEVCYDEFGKISQQTIYADSKELEQILNQFDWQIFPSPAIFGLPFRKTSVTILIKNDLIFVD